MKNKFKKGVGEHENWMLFKGKTRQGTRRVSFVGRVM
jgi:hypothetical protein